MIALVQVLTVAEYLNFRHAASVLGVSQSSVSARVKALEEELGVLLFERHARGVRLTQAGRHTIDGIATALDQLDYTIKSAGMLARGERGQLRIGVHALIPGSFFSKLLHLYREQYPDIEVQIIEDTARDALTQLRTGQLDIAFVVGMPELPDCRSRRIWAEPLVAALPERHRHADHTGVTWTDIANETFVVRHGGTGPQVYDHIVQRLAGRCYAPSILRLAVERSTILSMVEQGFGITVTGSAVSLVPAPGVVFLPIVDEPEPIAFSAVWSPFNRDAPLRNLLALADQMDSPEISSRRTLEQRQHGC